MFFFFKQKTAYEMSISDWSSDVCSSDLIGGGRHRRQKKCRNDFHVAPFTRRASAGDRAARRSRTARLRPSSSSLFTIVSGSATNKARPRASRDRKGVV